MGVHIHVRPVVVNIGFEDAQLVVHLLHHVEHELVGVDLALFLMGRWWWWWRLRLGRCFGGSATCIGEVRVADTRPHPPFMMQALLEKLPGAPLSGIDVFQKVRTVEGTH